MKTRRDYREQHKHHSRKIRAEEAKRSKGIPARIEAIGRREDVRLGKVPGRDPLDGLALVGPLKGRKIG